MRAARVNTLGGEKLFCDDGGESRDYTLIFFPFFFRGVRAGVPFYRGMFAPLTITSVFLREAGWFSVWLALC